MKWIIVYNIYCDTNALWSIIWLEEMLGTNRFRCFSRKLMVIENKIWSVIDKDSITRVLSISNFLFKAGSEASSFLGDIEINQCSTSRSHCFFIYATINKNYRCSVQRRSRLFLFSKLTRGTEGGRTMRRFLILRSDDSKTMIRNQRNCQVWFNKKMSSKTYMSKTAMP